MLNSEISVSERGDAARHELRVDGEAVAGLEVVYRSMRVGCASVRMGGIASVGTEPKHRNRGCARQLLEHANRWMTQQGFDCAVLFGIQDFYYRFGYAACLVDSDFVIATRDAERAEPHLTARPVAPEDRAAILAIHNGESGERTGCIVRGEGEVPFRHGTRWFDRTEAAVFCAADGAVRAYAARDVADTYVTVCEVGAADPSGYADVLRWAAARAVDCRCGDIRFMVPSDHPFVDYAAQFGGRQSSVYPRCSDGMGRILNLVPFLKAISPDLARRARRAEAPAGSAVVETDIGSARIEWDGHAVTVAPVEPGGEAFRLPQCRLMQIAMGYHSVRTIAAMPEVTPSGGIELLSTLFERRPAYMWVPDHF